MAHPIFSVPLLSSNPVGWAILGAAGYVAYKAGKKAGLKSEEKIEEAGIGDRALKSAMKTVYKTKMKLDDSLHSTKEKYSGMWNEAQAEVDGAAQEA